MKQRKLIGALRHSLMAFYLFGTLIFLNSTAGQTKMEVRAAMRKTTDFMMRTVSNRGGFLWQYSADLSEQWGEIPARKSQIWVQPPGTASVGMVLIKAFQATGDTEYLRYAENVAGTLIFGQHPSGGWHYLIDFDPSGLQQWYDKVAAECWGWEEFYHYYGNATFDDEVTVSAARFLLNLYLTTLDPKYKSSLVKALDFILVSQYPNGAWPQRYPLRYDFVHDGHADYTSYYTYNDQVISGNIFFLLEAFRKLGNAEYVEAARRGMDFYLLSQLPAPQAGWGMQYDLELKAAWARAYEPASVASPQTVENIRSLESFYKITGDRRYLRPIPDAIQWLENSVINTDVSKKFTHATFYEIGTNRPLYAHREGSGVKDGRYWVDYKQELLLDHYGMTIKVDLPSIKKEFDRVRSLSVEQTRAEVEASAEAGDAKWQADQHEIQKIISSTDERGAWVEDLRIPYYPDVLGHPRRVVKGISTRAYVSNMEKLISYLKK